MARGDVAIVAGELVGEARKAGDVRSAGKRIRGSTEAPDVIGVGRIEDVSGVEEVVARDVAEGREALPSTSHLLRFHIPRPDVEILLTAARRPSGRKTRTASRRPSGRGSPGSRQRSRSPAPPPGCTWPGPVRTWLDSAGPRGSPSTSARPAAPWSAPPSRLPASSPARICSAPRSPDPLRRIPARVTRTRVGNRNGKLFSATGSQHLVSIVGTNHIGFSFVFKAALTVPRSMTTPSGITFGRAACSRSTWARYILAASLAASGSVPS